MSEYTNTDRFNPNPNPNPTQIRSDQIRSVTRVETLGVRVSEVFREISQSERKKTRRQTQSTRHRITGMDFNIFNSVGSNLEFLFEKKKEEEEEEENNHTIYTSFNQICSQTDNTTIIK
ncbi:expressed protein [Phakopsora pachyrhizi]|uniref:Expressed protein n=1 Tax=Phakopsora pachyrhizi TaxID=170000 RepID=A0AAV0AY01_PHAPC|nr:expressed protein [Phakopsora pachyrhizi]